MKERLTRFGYFSTGSDQFVLRLNKDRPVEEALAEYALESACYQAVDSGTGPRVQSVGEYNGRAFLFLDYVKGSKGQSLDAELAWRHLGQALRLQLFRILLMLSRRP